MAVNVTLNFSQHVELPTIGTGLNFLVIDLYAIIQIYANAGQRQVGNFFIKFFGFFKLLDQLFFPFGGGGHFTGIGAVFYVFLHSGHFAFINTLHPVEVVKT
jgi:hypothetical protein